VETLKTYLSKCVQNFMSIGVNFVQFRIQEQNFLLLKSHLFTTHFWTDSDLSVSDLRSVCFAGLVCVLGTF
jgi:hypothetical protein